MDPTPLEDYYDDYDTHTANLEDFDPSQRLEASVNGEGTVFISDVNVQAPGLDLGKGSMALHQVSTRSLPDPALSAWMFYP